MIKKDSFLTVAYKQGYIHTHIICWLNGRVFERVHYTPKDGLGMMPAKTILGAKRLITKWAKNNEN